MINIYHKNKYKSMQIKYGKVASKVIKQHKIVICESDLSISIV